METTITAKIAYPACGLTRVATFQADAKQVDDSYIVTLHSRRPKNGGQGDAFWQFDLGKTTLLQGKQERALLCEGGFVFLLDKFNRFIVD